MSARHYDVVVIGAGMAGASAAAFLAPHRRVLLVERESQPGYHTTGRSAALLTPHYGNAVVRRLNLAGATFYREPPPGFADAPLLRPRGALSIARRDDLDLLEEEYGKARAADPATERLDPAAARALVPLLRADYVAGAFLDPAAADMDVAAILQGFLRTLRRDGGEIAADAELIALSRDGGAWRIELRDRTVLADIVVDAAGAWADPVAALAGLTPLGIQPKRRTAMLIDAPSGHEPRRWPAVANLPETFYVKPDAGKLLCSPADETPDRPSDAQPDEMDVAVCVERVQEAFELEIRRIDHSWAGLRCFAPDRTPVVGFDPRAEGFFWLAGQGGYGIMAAPALAGLTAQLIAGAEPPGWLEGVDTDALAPARLL